MGILDQIFGSEIGVPARFVVAFVVVVVLIALAVWLIRFFGSATLTRVGGLRGRQPRLAVLEVAAVDARRRLVLIRRDNFEHLLMIGGPTDVVVEPNIVRASAPVAPAAPTAPATPAALATQAAPTPREPIVRASERPAVAESSLTETESPLVPAQASAPEPIEASPEPPAPVPEPRPAARIDPQYSEMAERLEAALRRPIGTAPMPRVEPIPEPRVEPRVETRPAPIAPKAAPVPRPAQVARAETRQAPMQPAPRPEPAPTPRPQPAVAAHPSVQAQPASEPAPTEPRSRPVQHMAAKPPAQPRPTPAAPPAPPKPAPKRDVFDNLEEEMANLLGRSKQPN
jgi:hypothetical protein